MDSPRAPFSANLRSLHVSIQKLVADFGVCYQVPISDFGNSIQQHRYRHIQQACSDILSLAIIELCRPKPQTEIARQCRALYDSTCHAWCLVPGLKNAVPNQMLLALLGSLVTLLEMRLAAFGGKRMRRTAHKTIKSLPVAVQYVVVRAEDYASKEEINVLYRYLRLQIDAIFGQEHYADGKDLYFIYQMCKYGDTYIGRCISSRARRTHGGGLTYRIKEHISLYHKHIHSTVTKSQIRSRYYITAKSPISRYPTFLALAATTATKAAALEAAYIGYYLPTANNVERTFGAHGQNPPKGKLHDQHRQKSNTKWAITKIRLLNFYLQRQHHQKLCDTQHLRNRQITAKIATFKQLQAIEDETLKKIEKLSTSFDSLYQGCQKELRGLGPINIYDNLDLLIKMASIRPQSVEWDYVTKRHGLDIVYYVYTLFDFVVNYHCKMRGRTSLTSYAKTKGILILPALVITVAHKSHIQSVKAWASRLLRSERTTRPHWYAFYHGGTSVVSRANPTWRQELVNIQKYCRTFPTSDLYDQPRGVNDLAWFGLDMVQIRANLNVPILTTRKDEWEITKASCSKWASRLEFPKTAPQLPRKVRSIRQPIQTVKKVSHLTRHHQYFALDSQLKQLQTNPNTIFTQQDKNISMLWAQRGPQTIVRQLQLLNSSGRWKLEETNEDLVTKHYQKWLNTCFPKNITLDTNNAFSKKNIPCLYPTVKEKCFSGGRILPHSCHEEPQQASSNRVLKSHKPDKLIVPHRTCKKPKHSCYRNIVSFSRMP